MSALQQKLKVILADQDLSISELERRAGLKPSAVRNILSGQSKNPTAETLLALARTLGCSIEELLDVKSEIKESNSRPEGRPDSDKTSPIIENLHFLQKVTNEVIAVVEKNYNNRHITLKDMTDFFRETYKYSLKNTYPEVDLKFADWVISRRLEDKDL